jgi:CRP-like cAMP-binding protein
VKKGRLQVIAEDEDGKSRVVHALHEGAVFGELR